MRQLVLLEFTVNTSCRCRKQEKFRFFLSNDTGNTIDTGIGLEKIYRPNTCN